MGNYPKKAILKNGRTAILRLLESYDREKLHTFFMSIPPSDRAYLRRDVTSFRIIDQIIAESQEPNCTRIVAELDKRIIGVGSISHPVFGWMRKVGELRLVIGSDYQHQSLGSILARELFVAAVKMQLDKVSVRMAEGQKNATRCFEKLGFNREGVLDNFIIDADDNLHKMMIMSLDL